VDLSGPGTLHARPEETSPFRKRPRAQGGKDPGRPEWDIRIRPRVHQPHTIRQTVIAWRVHSNLEFPPVNREVREPSVCLLQVHAYGNKKKKKPFGDAASHPHHKVWRGVKILFTYCSSHLPVAKQLTYNGMITRPSGKINSSLWFKTCCIFLSYVQVH
jgi:hypothetical protein